MLNDAPPVPDALSAYEEGEFTGAEVQRNLPRIPPMTVDSFAKARRRWRAHCWTFGIIWAFGGGVRQRAASTLGAHPELSVWPGGLGPRTPRNLPW